jgi:hypothetical protein
VKRPFKPLWKSTCAFPSRNTHARDPINLLATGTTQGLTYAEELKALRTGSRSEARTTNLRENNRQRSQFIIASHIGFVFVEN